MPGTTLIRGIAIVVVCASAAVPGARARAQTAADAASGAADDEARARFEAGRIAYAASRYDDALADFEHAYALSERPELLYNMAQCHDRLRHDADAIDAFARYLAALPDAPNRIEVETRLDALRHAEAERRDRESTLAAAATPSTEVEAAAPTSPSGGIETEWWLWTLIGVAVVGAGVGIGVGVAASSAPTSPPISGDVGPGGVVTALFSW